MRRRSKGEVILIHIGLIIATAITLLPMLWILRTALITKNEAYKIPPNMAAPLTLDNFIQIFKEDEFLKYFLNSAVVSILSTVIAVALGAMAAYWLARQKNNNATGKIIILITQMIPPIVMVIPISSIAKSLNLSDTWLALILAYLSFTLPYVIWMLIGFIENVPSELDEAAEIDGCTPLQTFFKVVFPLIAPGMMATAVYSFLTSWNEFIFALVLTGRATRTLPVYVASLETSQGVAIAQLCAATIVAILPILLLSQFIKKYLINGLTFGAIK